MQQLCAAILATHPTDALNSAADPVDWAALSKLFDELESMLNNSDTQANQIAKPTRTHSKTRWVAQASNCSARSNIFSTRKHWIR